MLRPSYTDLLDAVVNDGVDEDIASSRYSIVIASAKRARQLIDNPQPLTDCEVDRPVSIAVKELFEGKIKITNPPAPVEEEEVLEETEEAVEEVETEDEEDEDSDSDSDSDSDEDEE